MRWTSWLRRARQRRLCVVGLDLGPDACRLVVLSGTAVQAERVCCAERLQLPEGWLVNGEVMQPEPLGQWLRTYLEQGGYQPELAYLGLDSACVSQHCVTLAAGLSPADVTFQLQAEVQLMWPESAAEVCMDYTVETDVSTAHPQPYWVQVAPRRRVEVLQALAQHAGLPLAVVESRQDAAQRTERSKALTGLSQTSVALALQCENAFGLALRAWHDEGFNFLPHREDAEHALRRAWLLRAATCAVGGVVLAAGFVALIDLAVKAQQAPIADVAASARAFADAQTAHAKAKARQDRHAEQSRWLKAKQNLQSQSLQWSRVLSQAAQGVWVVSVKQQGTHWTVQGEALSAKHAQQLVQQLKALDIWAQAPELPQLQAMPAVSTTGWPVWQFRIEADLKVGA